MKHLKKCWSSGKIKTIDAQHVGTYFLEKYATITTTKRGEEEVFYIMNAIRLKVH